MKKVFKVRKLNDAHAEVFDTIINLPFYCEHLSQVLGELEPRKGSIFRKPP
jgi:hypothetical protein